MPKQIWTSILLVMLPHVAGNDGMHRCAIPLLEMGSCELFAEAGLELPSS
jgi:hypothetical protein